MKLLEYEAKNILKQYNIPVPIGNIFDIKRLPDFFPVVLKSQVPTGGRGKLGGIKIVNNRENLSETYKTLLDLPIKGYRPRNILAEEVLPIQQEFYLSLTINRDTETIDLIAHKNGGVEIESQNNFFQTHINPSNISKLSMDVSEIYGLEEKAFLIEDLLSNLYRCFVENDLILLEINPLILTKDNKLIAGDCKMQLDDMAYFRHPEWNFESHSQNHNFVELNREGTVATIANGAGLAMATIDEIYNNDLIPANFLDIGGNITIDSLENYFKKIIDFPNIDYIIINIFGGIVQCDLIAKAIIDAKKKFDKFPTLFIRLNGNRSHAAVDILNKNCIKCFSNLSECIEALKNDKK